MIKNCKQCGSPASVDYGGAASECYGWAWQSMSVQCSDTLGQKCGASLRMDCDPHYYEDYEDILIEAWNKIND
jgi:hypothetical protein